MNPETKAALRRYGKNLLIGFDQFLNAVFGGWPDETLSSRAHRLKLERGRVWPARIIDVLALVFGDKNHCEASWKSEFGRLQSPTSMRVLRTAVGASSETLPCAAPSGN